MKISTCYGKLSVLSSALLSISASIYATEPQSETPASTVSESSTQVLPTLSFKASAEPQKAKDDDISAVPKTIITQEEMLQYGDQSVMDALRRAAGFQIPSFGQGPRGGGGASGMRFRGGGAPTFLVNGEPVQGGPRGGMSVIDTITPEMIERIEVVKQPSVAQASVASSAVINIILKEPLDTRLNGSVKLGYGLRDSGEQQSERKQINIQADGRENQWSYSVSANQMWMDNTSITKTETATGTREQLRTVNRTMQMFSPRLQYDLDDQQKLIAELFYRNIKMDGYSSNQTQDDKNDSIRLNTRYERKDKDLSDKIRLSVERQTETQLTRSPQNTIYTDETVNEYGLAYDGVRKLDKDRQIKFGFDTRSNELDSNVSKSLDEQRYAVYGEGSWRFTDRQTVTLGARQEWLNRSGLVDYQDQHLSPVLAYRFDLTEQWSIQTNLSQAFKSPNTDRLVPNVTVSTDSDAGSLNNPDRGGNPNLKPEKIRAAESTLAYDSASGGVSVTAYHREIKDYIEKVIALEGTRYVERPQNQDQATTYGVELSGRYALKQTEAGHAFMLNGQVSTVRAKIEDGQHRERLASDVAPYNTSAGLSYSYKPWQLSTSVNVSYTPEFTRALDGQPYDRTTNERFSLDLSATKRFSHGWAASLNLNNVLSTHYKERLTNQTDGSLYQARTNESIPSLQFSLEKKF
ncbi:MULTISPECIES: TonB-dependent siderophore receptor [Acinetobacter]|uniref:TonB-dependent receptor plug domain-containing protein n=1 Tax=Acinetobacter TaxID=469 RepID=UPI00051C6AF2|nr:MULTISPECIES: TonB-dependent receptor [Acinetobacter]MCH7379209.1 TonB-dependent receptor [Acinetobacter higginsii]MCJ0828889.1 TonB-dependent receptor [Acinetobacter sp. NIPH1876]